MSILPGLLILVTFAIFAGLMMSRRMPALIALPCMAVVIACISGAFFDWPPLESIEKPSYFTKFVLAYLPSGVADWYKSLLQTHMPFFDFVAGTVITKGAARLAGTMMFAIFGAILSQLIMRAGIAQRIVGVAAEYAGDRKMLLAGLLTICTGVCFMAVTGLGAVIMIGSLVLPILIGAGLSAEFSACLMLFAITAGGMFNPVNIGFYTDVLKISQAEAQDYVLVYGLLMVLVVVAFFFIRGRAESKSYAWAASAPAVPPSRVPLLSLLTPILPIGLIIAFSFPVIPAFLVGIFYGALTTSPKQALKNITAASLEGLKDISPVIGLFIGIGMALNAMMADATQAVLKPFLEVILPQSPVSFFFFFAILAPLALYRGPLNFYGLGAGVAGLIMGAKLMPVLAVMASFFAVGQIQGVCDPTNTHNVWLATFTKSSTEKFLKITIPYVWLFVVLALGYAAFIDGVMSK